MSRGGFWTVLRVWYSSDLLSFKSISILSSSIACVLMQSRLWSLNQISETSAYLLKCMLKYVFCSLGQVKHGKY